MNPHDTDGATSGAPKESPNANESAPAPADRTDEHRDATVPHVRVEPLGRVFEAPDTLTVLEAAGFANLRLPRSCRNGTCRTCLCRVIEGKVRHTIEWPGLSAEEKAEGYILPCVAVAETDLVIEAPGAVDLDASPPGKRNENGR